MDTPSLLGEQRETTYLIISFCHWNHNVPWGQPINPPDACGRWSSCRAVNPSASAGRLG